jgi:hypothetical protein
MTLNAALIDLNEDLIRIRNWCFDNLLLLNPGKIKLMVYGSRQMLARLPEFRLTLLGKELTPAATKIWELRSTQSSPSTIISFPPSRPASQVSVR